MLGVLEIDIDHVERGEDPLDIQNGGTVPLSPAEEWIPKVTNGGNAYLLFP